MSTAGSPAKVIVDTSVYIPFINDGVAHPLLNPAMGNPILYMSAVVMEELYAGALDKETIKLLDKLHSTFESVGRLVVPDAANWRLAGMTVAKMGRKYGFDRTLLSSITKDILIAVSARQIGAYVVTGNTRDFLRIREFVEFKLAAD